MVRRFGNIQVNDKEHLNFLIRRKIFEVFGSQEEELKYHRLAVKGLYLQLNSNANGGSVNGEIEKIKQKVMPKFLEVEKIVQEGNDLCKQAGWV